MVDGGELVEAVEDPAKRFAVGVQWHPEESDDRRLFEALVEAARTDLAVS
jgi:putative glutamine amidotransferase